MWGRRVLTDGDSHLRPALNLRDSSGSNGVLRVLSDIDVTRQFRPATLVDDVIRNLRIADDARVLLAWVDSCAIPRQLRLDWSRSQYPVYEKSITGAYLPWKATLAGDPLIPWALRRTPWAWTSPRRAAMDNAFNDDDMMGNMCVYRVHST